VAGAEPFDVLVLGGGPGGAAAACGLARTGARVLLVERHDFATPRPGEHLAGAVRERLDRLGIGFPRTSGLVQSSPGIVSLWIGEPTVRSYRASGEPQGLCVVRHRFDKLLLGAAEEAGAATMLRTRLASACRAGNQWQVRLLTHDGSTSEVTAAAIIEATGRRASFARAQGARRTNHGDLSALVAWLGKETRRAEEPSLLLVEACPSGWWSLSAAIGGYTIATHYTSLAALKASRVSRNEFWQSALEQAPAVQRVVRPLAAQPSAFAIYPAFPAQTSKIAGDGWIAVGDAAAALDPVGGQGVLFALETAARAVEALTAEPSLATLGPIYENAVRARLDRHLAGRARLYADADRILPEIAERMAAPAKPSGGQRFNGNAW
jgi:flavin-dependent dehydrogenase